LFALLLLTIVNILPIIPKNIEATIEHNDIINMVCSPNVSNNNTPNDVICIDGNRYHDAQKDNANMQGINKV
jgi:hypothetical protein